MQFAVTRRDFKVGAGQREDALERPEGVAVGAAHTAEEPVVCGPMSGVTIAFF